MPLPRWVHASGGTSHEWRAVAVHTRVNMSCSDLCRAKLVSLNLCFITSFGAAHMPSEQIHHTSEQLIWRVGTRKRNSRCKVARRREAPMFLPRPRKMLARPPSILILSSLLLVVVVVVVVVVAIIIIIIIGRRW